jgi:hypothetical protein
MTKPICILSGPVFNRSGYGDWATDVAKSLIRYGKFDLRIAPQKWGMCQQSRQFLNQLTDPEDIAVRKCFMTNNRLERQPEIYIGMSIPNEFATPAKYNIGMTAGIETTLCSGEFLDGVNKVDLTIALSDHVKSVFQNTKLMKNFPDGRKEQVSLKKPVEVCFWGANTDVYKKTDEKLESVEKALQNIEEEFAFLFVGQWTSESKFNDRKDIGNLVKTFCNTFKNQNKKPCLILKSAGPNYSITDRYKILNNIKEIKNSIEGDLPNVYLLHGELHENEMNALINHEKVKCHVSFTHGEGFGHPLLLQTLSGKPLLVPEWSGHLDFLNKEYAEFLPGTLANVPPQSTNKWILKESQWFNVAYSLAEQKLNKMFHKATDEKVLKKAELLRKENEEKFSLKKMDEKLWSILDQYVPKFATENKFVLPQLKSLNNDGQDNKIKLPKLKPLNDSDGQDNKIKLPKLKLV